MNTKVCVFCASSNKCDKVFIEEASKLGKYLALSGRDIIYGGGKVGLMGALADSAMKAGGNVVGVIPEFMYEEDLGHSDVSEMIVVRDMHSRKKIMFTNSSCLIALPGGLGTMDELIEAITWKQLNIITVPIIIININDYFKPLLEMLEKSVSYGFTAERYLRNWITTDSVDEAMEFLNYLYPSEMYHSLC